MRESSHFDEQHLLARHLIRHKVNSMIGKTGWTSQDREDLEQELMLQLLMRINAFDPQRGSFAAFVSTIVKHEASRLIRHRMAEKRRAFFPQSLSRPLTNEDQQRRQGTEVLAEQGAIDLAIDMKQMLSDLPVALRELAEGLKQETLSELSRKWKVPRSTLQSRIKTLREILKQRL